MTEQRGQQPPHPAGTPAPRPGAMPPPPPAISGRHADATPGRSTGSVPGRPGVTPPAPGGGPAGATQRTRVVVVDDHAMFRSGVKTEIGQRVDVVGEAADVDSAVAVIAQTHPDVVLLDVHLPGGGGVEVLRRVHLVDADQKFLALSVSDAAEDVIGVIRGGARGYVTKSINGDELIDAIRRVSEGDAVFSPRLAGFVLDAFSGAIDLATIDEDLDRLSQREREVLRLIARGYAYKEVAKELFISIKTVETHVSSVLRKLQLSNRHQLTRWATDRRLV
jgi:DNA-binding NarL/FixJ family response regulator